MKNLLCLLPLLSLAGCAGTVCAYVPRDSDVQCEDIGVIGERFTSLLTFSPTGSQGAQFGPTAYPTGQTLHGALADYGAANAGNTGVSFSTTSTNFLRLSFHALSNPASTWVQTLCQRITSVNSIGIQFEVQAIGTPVDFGQSLSWKPATFNTLLNWEPVPLAGGATVPPFTHEYYSSEDFDYSPEHVEKDDIGCGQDGPSGHELQVQTSNMPSGNQWLIYSARATASINTP